uniref:Uncharacterized protein n=1 Tax=Anguilla anguilla TaxID=7936 RepID=A0A0E9PKZ0_ANGAN
MYSDQGQRQGQSRTLSPFYLFLIY